MCDVIVVVYDCHLICVRLISTVLVLAVLSPKVMKRMCRNSKYWDKKEGFFQNFQCIFPSRYFIFWKIFWFSKLGRFLMTGYSTRCWSCALFGNVSWRHRSSNHFRHIFVLGYSLIVYRMVCWILYFWTNLQKVLTWDRFPLINYHFRDFNRQTMALHMK